MEAGLEIREYGHRDPARWPRGTLYPQKLALTSPTSGGRSAVIVHSRTKATERDVEWKTNEYVLGRMWKGVTTVYLKTISQMTTERLVVLA
jgi:hypothetical protein